MSFLHNMYAKFISNTNAKRKDSYVNDNSESSVFEDFDNEDGFVVYTERDSTAVPTSSMHPYDFKDKLEYNSLQNSATGCHYPSGSSLQTPYSYGSTIKECSRGMKNETASTFITASDIPLKLSKPLEMIYNTNKTMSDMKNPSIDVGQFFYDFHLEKTVMNSCEDNTGEMR